MHLTARAAHVPRISLPKSGRIKPKTLPPPISIPLAILVGMDVTAAVHSALNPLPASLSESHLLLSRPRPFPSLSNPSRRRRSRGRGPLRAFSASGTGDGPTFSWKDVSESIRRGSERFRSRFGGYLREETGFDFEEASLKAGGLLVRFRDAAAKGYAAVDRFRLEILPQFIEWNKWENWQVSLS